MTVSILFIGNYPPPYGGVPHHLERLTNHLSSKEYECFVLAGGSASYELKENGVHVFKMSSTKKLIYFLKSLLSIRLEFFVDNFFFLLKNPRWWIRSKIFCYAANKIIKENNIDLISSYNLLAYSVIGSIIAKEHKIPHVINIFGEIYKNDFMIEEKEIFKKVVNHSEEIVSCSRHCGLSLKKIDPSKEVDFLTYGIDLNHFNFQRKEEDKAFLIHKDKINILFVGRLSHEMGLNHFLKLVTNKDLMKLNIYFTALGQEGDLYLQAKSLSERQSNFDVISNIDYEDLPFYYIDADLCIVPTTGQRTCSSLASMEAMASKAVVIANEIGGIPELIEHKSNGFLVSDNNHNEYAEYIELLATNSTMLEKLKEESYRYAHDNFDENRVNVHLEKKFSQLINPKYT